MISVDSKKLELDDRLLTCLSKYRMFEYKINFGVLFNIFECSDSCFKKDLFFDIVYSEY
jgi:hypothetical protein